MAQRERVVALDVLRGAALFGVLLVNLETLFRVSLFEHILKFHTHPGAWNCLTDVLVAALLEFKAFPLFSFLFGVGIAIQAGRAASRGVNVPAFLVRRFVVLLALGLCHLLLIWNGDILTLYAVCGLLVVPLLRLPARLLAALGVAVILLPFAVNLPIHFPSEEALRAQAAAAAEVYRTGGFVEIQAFRWHETGRFIVGLLAGVLPQTVGLMLCGAAAWRSKIFVETERRRRLLQTIFAGALAVGATATALQVYSKSTGHKTGAPSLFLELGSNIPLALSYAAGFLLWLTPARLAAFGAPFAAAGQMALTNYLSQSVVLGAIFYGYGLGLFGRLGSAPAALIGIALYAVQLCWSRLWLVHYRFGPAEWLWRSLTYGNLQPMRREP